MNLDDRPAVSSIVDHLKREKIPLIWLYYYRLKSLLIASEIIKISDIYIDTNDDSFSYKVKKRLRMKRYEDPEQNLIENNLYPDMPIIDLGGGIGFTGCLIDKLTYKDTQIIVVEANKDLIPTIKMTKKLNDCEFTIVNSVYSPNSETGELYIPKNFWSASGNNTNENTKRLEVNACSISSLLNEYNISNNFQLVVDIEGAESTLLSEESEILKNRCKMIILELHDGSGLSSEKSRTLFEENGFDLVESIGDCYCYKNIDI